MSDKIKEILDRLERIDHKEYSCGFEFADSGSFDEDCRCFEERKKLADYITNLQEENERLNLELSGYREAILRDDKLLGLKSRIDKAIEYLKKEKENYLTKGVSLADTNIGQLIVSAAVNTCSCGLNILTGGDKE